MRSSSLFIFSGAAMGLAGAAPVFGSVLDNILPSRFGSDRTTGAVLESLRILPDDDNDGLLDVKGSLKVLEDGELLNLGGVVRVGDLVEACVDVVIDGVPTKRCDKKGRGRKHRQHLSNDDWSKEEHRRCSAHFKSWHRQHGSHSCSDKLREAERKIRELEKKLQECRPDQVFQHFNAIKTHTKPAQDREESPAPAPTWSEGAQNWSPQPKPEENNWQPEPSTDNNDWKPEQPEQPEEQWRDETNNGKDCKNGVYTYTGEDKIRVKACIAAKVDVGPVHAEADVKADATVDLKEGKVNADAKANAKVGVDGVAEVTTKNSVKADVDLKKGQADVKVSTDDTLKVGDTKVLDTGLDAEVKVNKPCSEGTTLNALGVCVKLTSNEDKPAGATNDLLGNVLGGARVL